MFINRAKQEGITMPILNLKQISVKLASVLTAFVMLFTQVYCAFLPKRDIYPKTENTVRIMTFNLLCRGTGEKSMLSRKGIVAQTIAEYYPDSIGVQEATPAWMLWLRTQLPEYDYVGVGRDDGHILGEFAAIFYLKDKYKVVDSGNFWLSETPDVPSKGWDAGCNRICTWVVLENKVTGEQYAHINTHLDNTGALARQNGVAMILEKAATFDIPTVCTGDFNLREGSSLYKTLVAGTLHDSKFLAPDSISHATYNDFQPTSDPQNIIDFILVNNKVTPLVYRVVSAGIDGKMVSDHYPVYSDMLINAG
jgi:endonuclease/exonuclease/phosphatase family metal-dependent hydrolase